jgi:putative endonuclease
VRVKIYYVYILSCRDHSFYTGYTNSLERRIKLHKKGIGARYTHIHGVDKIIHWEVFATRSEAMHRERQIKRLTHDQKAKLFREDLSDPNASPT